MKRVRVGIIGANSAVEWSVLPTLSSRDIMAPPDNGAWWARRADSPDIHYQAPARPEIVAIAEAETQQNNRGQSRVERVAQTARVRATYSDWRAMLREVELDAIICVAPPHIAAEIVAATGGAKPLWIWGAPATSLSALARLQNGLRGRDKVWNAQTLRQSSAHRAARQLVEHDQIGAVCALSLRVPHALETAPEHDAARFSASLSAMDLVRHFAAQTATSSTRTSANISQNGAMAFAGAMAFENNGATHATLRLQNGAIANILFAGAETWSAPFPRLEIVGTQGRSMVCEAGRRLWLHHPREAARFWEPPGMSHHISAANVAGVAEDLKAFLAWCVDDATSSTRCDLRDEIASWQWLKTVNESLHTGTFALFSQQNETEEIDTEEIDTEDTREKVAKLLPIAPVSATLTLPLS